MVGQEEVLNCTQKVPDDVADAERGAASARDVAARLREVEPLVRGICRSQLGSIDGDDAAQRVMVRLWRALEEGRVQFDSLPAYAAACARYSRAESYRAAQRLPVPSEFAEQTWADDAVGPAEQVERADAIAHARERVAALLEQLTPREAQVMQATVLADRSNAEAAAELGMTTDQVRQRRIRAMARLREACGTTSPNPRAMNLSSAEREKRRWVAEKARLARQAEAAGSGGERVDEVGARTDPMHAARHAVESLTGGRDRESEGDSVEATDPLVRASAAVDVLLIERRGADAEAHGSTDQAAGVAEYGQDSGDQYGFDHADHGAGQQADAVGAA
jgi:RNA polymerase sigma factor (sigma-70 family)